MNSLCVKTWKKVIIIYIYIIIPLCPFAQNYCSTVRSFGWVMTALPHQSHTGRRSTSRRRVAASASWVWCPTLPTSHSADSTNGQRCGYSPQQPPPTRICSSFSSPDLQFNHDLLMQSYKKSTKYARKIFTFSPENWQKMTMSDSHPPVLRPLQRVRKRKTTRSSWEDNTLKSDYSEYSETRSEKKMGRGNCLFC